MVEPRYFCVWLNHMVNHGKTVWSAMVYGQPWLTIVNHGLPYG